MNARGVRVGRWYEAAQIGACKVIKRHDDGLYEVELWRGGMSGGRSYMVNAAALLNALPLAKGKELDEAKELQLTMIEIGRKLWQQWQEEAKQ